MRRYRIWVREMGSDTERLVCEVDRRPEEIASALRERDSTASVRIEDHEVPTLGEPIR
jgi:hypothetical protein